MPQEALLKLVVDNSSSSDNDTPRSRANRRRGKWYLPGIPLRLVHCQTAFSEIPNSAAKRSAPPKRSMTHLGSMGEHFVPDRCSGQELFIPMPENLKFHRVAHNARMAQRPHMQREVPDIETWRATVFERLQYLLKEMGWGEDAFVDFMEADVIRVNGCTKKTARKTIRQWFEREAIPGYWKDVIAIKLGIDEHYLTGRHDDPYTGAEPYSLFLQQSELHRLRGA